MIRSKGLRLAIVIDGWKIAGAQYVISNLVREWQEQGHIVKVFVLFDKEPVISHDSIFGSMPLSVYGFSRLSDLMKISSFVKDIRHFQPDQIHAHLFVSQILTSLLFGASRVRWVEHNTYSHRSHLQWQIWKFLSKNVIAVSSEVQTYIWKKARVQSRVIRNPLVRSDFQDEVKYERTNRILFVGRLVEQKNPMLALDLFSDLMESGKIPPDTRFCIVGAGPLESVLRQQINLRNLRNSVEILGVVPNYELMKLMQSSKIFLSTSHIEGFGVARLEAFVNGMTVVTTQTAGLSDLISKLQELATDGLFVCQTVVDLRQAIVSSFSNVYWTHGAINDRKQLSKFYDVRDIAHEYLS